jgi:hypothetical protein
MPKRSGALHVATTTRRYKGKVYHTHLLRRTFRQDGKVKHQTVGNISHLPDDLIELIRIHLRGDPLPTGEGNFDIIRTLPHGHITAILGTIRLLGLDKILSSVASPQRNLVIALIVQRIIAPRSKLATARTLHEECATSSLALELDIELKDDRELYDAMDWLLARQERVEKKLARTHLHDGSLVLYDVSSSFYTGRHCSLAAFGHNRDGKNGYPQIVYGLLCNAEGCPVAIEVFRGNTADPATLSAQVQKMRERFALERVVIVGDRGMITSARIEETLRGVPGLDWITALRTEGIRELVEQGVIERSLFDRTDLLEVQSPEYQGERLIVCHNPFLEQERRRKRQELLAATEKLLDKIVAATQRAKKPLAGKDKIGLRVGNTIRRYKVGKHFILDIEENGFHYRRDEAKIAAEALLDGLYVVRTSVSATILSAESTVRAYKDLSKVERAFRSLKTVDLKIRPIYHRVENRVRAHVFLCMLAYYVEWHMRQKLQPILFDDDHRQDAEAQRESIVAPAPRSQEAKEKDRTRRSAEDLPVHSFQTLLSDLATLGKNRVRTSGKKPAEFWMLTRSTEVQQRVFDLLGVTPSA